MGNVRLPRRRFLALGAASLGGTQLAGCDRLSEAPDFQAFLASAEGLTYRVQRLLGGGHARAREFTASDVSPVFKVNGTRMPEGEDYAALREGNFADWRLRVDGLVALERTLDGTGQYYESIDLIDAFHPQTILAHGLNDVPLSVATVPRSGCGSNGSSCASS
jgi:DMSO/TMAO reductase YedYZ molybdopterin-dependent catalytic subunit